METIVVPLGLLAGAILPIRSCAIARRPGLLRLPQRPISGLRLTGVALLLGGVSVILTL